MKQVYILKDGQQNGPYSVETVGQLVQSGSISGEDLFWYEGAGDWKPVSELPEYAALARSPVSSPPLPIPRAAPTSIKKAPEATEDEDHSVWHYLGQGVAACVLMYLLTSFLFGGRCSSQSQRQTREAEEVSMRPQSRLPADPSVELLDFSTSWVSQSRGQTVLDGKIWVPEVTATVKNLGKDDLPNFIIRIAFINEKGIITSENKEWIRDLPAGYAKGPFFMRGTVGFKSDWVFADMAKDDEKKWRYDLFYSTSYNGPWKKVRSGYIALPTQYEQMFK